MLQISASTISIDQGTVALFEEFSTGGSMWSGSGQRMRVIDVSFSSKFRHPPAVQAGFALLDVSNSDALRLNLTVDNVTETGFKLTVETWGDTKVARASATWLAIGAANHEDDWEL